MSRLGGVIEIPGGGSNGNGAPKEGEQTGRQRGTTPLGWGGSFFGGQGFDGAGTGLRWMMKEGSLADGGGGQPSAESLLWWLWQIWPATYGTYRLMRGDPTIALARAIIFSPIIAAQWMIEPDEKNPPPVRVLNWIRSRIVPMRRRIVADALRAIDYGHQKFERVWQYREGLWGYERFKPLAPDQNAFLSDRKGNFLGIRPAGAGDEGADLLGLKAWHYTNDGEAGDLYGGELVGRSRLENVRETAWIPWLDTILKSERLRNKVSGILPIFWHPPGGFEDEPGGGFVSYQDACRTAAKALQKGDFVTIERKLMPMADIIQNPDLAKFGDIMLDFYDAGNVSEGQKGMIAEAGYYDSLKMRGMLRPERSGLEGKHGTLAEAGAHTDTGTTEAENWSDDFDERFNAGPLDDALAANWGEAMRGRVRVKTQPLVDAKAEVFRTIITEMIKKEPALAIAFARVLDLKEMFTGLDCPLTRAEIGAEIDRAIADAKPPAPTPGGSRATDPDDPDPPEDPKPGGAGDPDKPADDPEDEE